MIIIISIAINIILTTIAGLIIYYSLFSKSVHKHYYTNIHLDVMDAEGNFISKLMNSWEKEEKVWKDGLRVKIDSDGNKVWTSIT